MNRSASLVCLLGIPVFIVVQGCGQDRITQVPEVPDAGPPPICVAGEVKDCSTGLKGVCETGRQTCTEMGELLVAWSPCVSITASSVEVCDGKDNDCDGLSDEGGLCSTPPVVTCPADRTVNANSNVVLATAAVDPDSDAVTCAWNIASRPVTSSSNFSVPSSCTQTSYFADVVGSHNVRFTATDANGQSSTCSTTINVLPVGDLWLELTWDQNTDMDLHLQHPSAGDSHQPATWAQASRPNDCFWDEKTPSWDAPGTMDDPSLDRDDELFTGPENIRINSPVLGQEYKIGVHMFTHASMPTPVNVTLKVYCAGSLVTTQTRAFDTLGDLWVAGSVEYRGTDCVFKPDGHHMFVQPME
jgi:hypothetical protein